MDYREWIKREARLRSRILKDSQAIQQTGVYRICQNCGEVLLCHEVRCPNCDSAMIDEERLDNPAEQLRGGKRIRCRHRFNHLSHARG